MARNPYAQPPLEVCFSLSCTKLTKTKDLPFQNHPLPAHPPKPPSILNHQIKMDSLYSRAVLASSLQETRLPTDFPLILKLNLKHLYARSTWPGDVRRPFFTLAPFLSLIINSQFSFFPFLETDSILSNVFVLS